jgi:hypothetical protein
MKKITTTLQKVIGKHILIVDDRLQFKNVLGEVAIIKKSTQAGTVLLETSNIFKYLHYETEIECVVIDSEENPEYFI